MRGEIVIGNDSTEREVRSIMDIITLGAPQGATGFLRFSEDQSAAPLKITIHVIQIWEANDE